MKTKLENNNRRFLPEYQLDHYNFGILLVTPEILLTKHKVYIIPFRFLLFVQLAAVNRPT